MTIAIVVTCDNCFEGVARKAYGNRAMEVLVRDLLSKGWRFAVGITPGALCPDCVNKIELMKPLDDVDQQ